jgi:hypothetical protein
MLYQKKKPKNYKKLPSYTGKDIYDEIKGYEPVGDMIVLERLRKEFGISQGDQKFANINAGIVERDAKDYIYFGSCLFHYVDKLIDIENEKNN